MPAPEVYMNIQADALSRSDEQLPSFKRASGLSFKHPSSRALPVRVAFIGNHVPRQCGIATFTTDLCNAVGAEYGAAGIFVVAINDPHSSYAYPSRVRFQVAESDISSYRDAANFLNSTNVDLVSIQHEFGIFGGKAGSHILHLMRRLTKPIVTTLHTVLCEPDADQKMVMKEIAKRSNRLIVRSEEHTS